MLKRVMDYISKSEIETQKIASEVARLAIAGDIYGFYGDLGAGKSVFCRQMIRELLQDPQMNVPSPTFPLLQTYETPDFEIWHFDMYRLEDIEELYELGWEEALSGPLVLIEWPEKIETILPAQTKKIIIDILDAQTRSIKIKK